MNYEEKSAAYKKELEEIELRKARALQEKLEAEQRAVEQQTAVEDLRAGKFNQLVQKLASYVSETFKGDITHQFTQGRDSKKREIIIGVRFFFSPWDVPKQRFISRVGDSAYESQFHANLAANAPLDKISADWYNAIEHYSIEKPIEEPTSEVSDERLQQWINAFVEWAFNERKKQAEKK